MNSYTIQTMHNKTIQGLPGLRELREAKGLTRLQLASAVGVDPSTINRVESASAEAGRKLLVALADYFKVSTDQLLGRKEAV